MFDFGFMDSHKSYLQTLEEFSHKLMNYDKFSPTNDGKTNFEVQTQMLDEFYESLGKESEDSFEKDPISKLQRVLLPLLTYD